MQRLLSTVVLTLMLLSTSAWSAPTEFKLVMKGHQFQPKVLLVPAGIRIKLIIQNQDTNAEEFESKPMKREKLIPAGTTGVVYVGPLAPGEYGFVGEYHEEHMTGKLVAE